MKDPHRRLFEDVAWSTPRVFEQTRQRARELGLSTVVLPDWYDVDDAASLQLLLRETVDGITFSNTQRAYGAPHTTAFLKEGLRAGLLAAATSA